MPIAAAPGARTGSEQLLDLGEQTRWIAGLHENPIEACRLGVVEPCASGIAGGRNQRQEFGLRSGAQLSCPS